MCCIPLPTIGCRMHHLRAILIFVAAVFSKKRYYRAPVRTGSIDKLASCSNTRFNNISISNTVEQNNAERLTCRMEQLYNLPSMPDVVSDSFRTITDPLKWSSMATEGLPMGITIQDIIPSIELEDEEIFELEVVVNKEDPLSAVEAMVDSVENPEVAIYSKSLEGLKPLAPSCRSRTRGWTNSKNWKPESIARSSHRNRDLLVRRRQALEQLGRTHPDLQYRKYLEVLLNLENFHCYQMRLGKCLITLSSSLPSQVLQKLPLPKHLKLIDTGCQSRKSLYKMPSLEELRGSTRLEKSAVLDLLETIRLQSSYLMVRPSTALKSLLSTTSPALATTGSTRMSYRSTTLVRNMSTLKMPYICVMMMCLSLLFGSTSSLPQHSALLLSEMEVDQEQITNYSIQHQRERTTHHQLWEQPLQNQSESNNSSYMNQREKRALPRREGCIKGIMNNYQCLEYSRRIDGKLFFTTKAKYIGVCKIVNADMRDCDVGYELDGYIGLCVETPAIVTNLTMLCGQEFFNFPLIISPTSTSDCLPEKHHWQKWLPSRVFKPFVCRHLHSSSMYIGLLVDMACSFIISAIIIRAVMFCIKNVTICTFWLEIRGLLIEALYRKESKPVAIRNEVNETTPLIQSDDDKAMTVIIEKETDDVELQSKRSIRSCALATFCISSSLLGLFVCVIVMLVGFINVNDAVLVLRPNFATTYCNETACYRDNVQIEDDWNALLLDNQTLTASNVVSTITINMSSGEAIGHLLTPGRAVQAPAVGEHFLYEDILYGQAGLSDQRLKPLYLEYLKNPTTDAVGNFSICQSFTSDRTDNCRVRCLMDICNEPCFCVRMKVQPNCSSLGTYCGKTDSDAQHATGTINVIFPTKPTTDLIPVANDNGTTTALTPTKPTTDLIPVLIGPAILPIFPPPLISMASQVSNETEFENGTANTTAVQSRAFTSAPTVITTAVATANTTAVSLANDTTVVTVDTTAAFTSASVTAVKLPVLTTTGSIPTVSRSDRSFLSTAYFYQANVTYLEFICYNMSALGMLFNNGTKMYTVITRGVINQDFSRHLWFANASFMIVDDPQHSMVGHYLFYCANETGIMSKVNYIAFNYTCQNGSTLSYAGRDTNNMKDHFDVDFYSQGSIYQRFSDQNGSFSVASAKCDYIRIRRTHLTADYIGMTTTIAPFDVNMTCICAARQKRALLEEGGYVTEPIIPDPGPFAQLKYTKNMTSLKVIFKILETSITVNATHFLFSVLLEPDQEIEFGTCHLFIGQNMFSCPASEEERDVNRCKLTFAGKLNGPSKLSFSVGSACGDSFVLKFEPQPMGTVLLTAYKLNNTLVTDRPTLFTIIKHEGDRLYVSDGTAEYWIETVGMDYYFGNGDCLEITNFWHYFSIIRLARRTFCMPRLRAAGEVLDVVFYVLLLLGVCGMVSSILYAFLSRILNLCWERHWFVDKAASQLPIDNLRNYRYKYREIEAEAEIRYPYCTRRCWIQCLLGLGAAASVILLLAGAWQLIARAVYGAPVPTTTACYVDANTSDYFDMSNCRVSRSYTETFEIEGNEPKGHNAVALYILIGLVTMCCLLLFASFYIYKRWWKLRIIIPPRYEPAAEMRIHGGGSKPGAKLMLSIVCCMIVPCAPMQYTLNSEIPEVQLLNDSFWDTLVNTQYYDVQGVHQTCNAAGVCEYQMTNVIKMAENVNTKVRIDLYDEKTKQGVASVTIALIKANIDMQVIPTAYAVPAKYLAGSTWSCYPDYNIYEKPLEKNAYELLGLISDNIKIARVGAMYVHVQRDNFCGCAGCGCFYCSDSHSYSYILASSYVSPDVDSDIHVLGYLHQPLTRYGIAIRVQAFGTGVLPGYDFVLTQAGIPYSCYSNLTKTQLGYEYRNVDGESCVKNANQSFPGYCLTTDKGFGCFNGDGVYKTCHSTDCPKCQIAGRPLIALSESGCISECFARNGNLRCITNGTASKSTADIFKEAKVVQSDVVLNSLSEQMSVACSVGSNSITLQWDYDVVLLEYVADNTLAITCTSVEGSFVRCVGNGTCNCQIMQIVFNCPSGRRDISMVLDTEVQNLLQTCDWPVCESKAVDIEGNYDIVHYKEYTANDFLLPVKINNNLFNISLQLDVSGEADYNFLTQKKVVVSSPATGKPIIRLLDWDLTDCKKLYMTCIPTQTMNSVDIPETANYSAKTFNEDYLATKCKVINTGCFGISMYDKYTFTATYPNNDLFEGNMFNSVLQSAAGQPTMALNPSLVRIGKAADFYYSPVISVPLYSTAGVLSLAMDSNIAIAGIPDATVTVLALNCSQAFSSCNGLTDVIFHCSIACDRSGLLPFNVDGVAYASVRVCERCPVIAVVHIYPWFNYSVTIGERTTLVNGSCIALDLSDYPDQYGQRGCPGCNGTAVKASYNFFGLHLSLPDFVGAITGSIIGGLWVIGGIALVVFLLCRCCGAGRAFVKKKIV